MNTLTAKFHWCLLVSVALILPVRAAEPTRAQLDFFESKVRPVLVDKCYKCHSAQSEKVKGGLLLDSREDVLKGGKNGPAIVPGDPEKSLLIKAVRYVDEDLQMPPKGEKLSAAQITALEQWVKMGAPDPRVKSATAKTSNKYGGDSDRNHWAWQPLKKPAVPDVKISGWVATPVDNFIYAKLDENGLKPSAAADKRTLIRRATFDLIGLPPTQKEIDDLIACPKVISDAPKRDMKRDRGHLRNDMRLKSADDKFEFSVFMRRNEDLPENFSIGLVIDSLR